MSELSEYTDKHYKEFLKRENHQYYLDNIVMFKARYIQNRRNKVSKPLLTDKQKKESKKKAQKKWRDKNREYLNNYLKTWQRANPERIRAYKRKYHEQS